MRRIAEVMGIPAFRRLWTSAYLCCVGDWLSLLGLSSLLATLTGSSEFALSGVVATQLLPGLLLAPLAGHLADRFDRRKVMIATDLVRCALFLSIAVVGTTWWLLAANFLVGCCSMLWIPAKDSALPTLLHRPDQVQTASQLTLVTTYGLALLTGAGLYSVITAIAPNSDVHVIVVINGLLYLSSALVIATRLPEASGRWTAPPTGEPGMARDGLRYVRGSRLVRGLVIGIVGALTAGGTVIAIARPYANELHGGEAAFGTLVIAMFIGLVIGVVGTPRLRLPFGVAIVAAGSLLVAVAVAPHLWFALAAVGLVGACAGVAFVTGLTMIGAQVPDEVRGRVNAFVQALVKVVLFAATTTAPVLVDLVGVRPALLVAAVVAVLAGAFAHRQLAARHHDRVTEQVQA
ncbi:MFS transporter [Kutzneria sp. CA-103260]|uniref:MFS transporter n=1 Tax=Kutzneria sp. CA-103260 TaxID=2802641 RepID=UPI001BF10583|nr:MFS transporter [Kutzneria sp. CA-103260]QUQ69696.1 dTMP kinase [Kutzneria sp. CA-103260]